MVVSSHHNAEVEEEAWQTKTTSLNSGLRYIYETKKLWDVEFSIRGNKFKCHRLVLGAGSPKFAEMLLKPDAPREITDDLSSKVGFECLLQYIYTGELNTSNESEILEAYRAANRYAQDGLTKKCEEFFQDMSITCDNVVSVLNQAPDVEMLRSRCLNFIKQNSVAVLESKDFLEATPGTLQDIFAFNCLENVPIVILQKRVLEWGSNQFPEMEDYKVVRQHLIDIGVLGKIKIQNLSNEELTNLIVEYPEILTLKEYTMFNVHSFKPDKPLPGWCEL